jgi:hypothetical protein
VKDPLNSAFLDGGRAAPHPRRVLPCESPTDSVRGRVFDPGQLGGSRGRTGVVQRGGVHRASAHSRSHHHTTHAASRAGGSTQQRRVRAGVSGVAVRAGLRCTGTQLLLLSPSSPLPTSVAPSLPSPLLPPHMGASHQVRSAPTQQQQLDSAKTGGCTVRLWRMGDLKATAPKPLFKVKKAYRQWEQVRVNISSRHPVSVGEGVPHQDAVLIATFRVVTPPHEPCHSVSHLDTVTPSPFTSPSMGSSFGASSAHSLTRPTPGGQFLQAATKALPNAAHGDTRGAYSTRSPCLVAFQGFLREAAWVRRGDSDQARVHTGWASGDLPGRAATQRRLLVSAPPPAPPPRSPI